jgi:Cdc6-like AAA superfamily ATPase
VSNDVPWSRAPREARLAHLGKLFVERDIDTQITSILDKMREARLVYDEPRNAVITGETGVGKTKIFSRYLAANPTRRNEDGNIVRPVTLIDIRHSSSPRAVAQSILLGLGITKGLQAANVTDLARQAKYNLVRQKVEIVMLDEFHNTLTDAGNMREETRSNRIAEWVKDLCKTKDRTPEWPDGTQDENIPFVMIGTRKVLNIVNADQNPELASLTPFNISIPRYRSDGNEGMKEFETFLRKLDNELPFDKFSGIAEGGLAEKIHVATYGLLRQVHHLVTYAAEIAIVEGDAGIREHHLHRSIEDQRNLLQSNLLVDADEKGRVVVNPFAPPTLRQKPVSPKNKSGWKEA